MEIKFNLVASNRNSRSRKTISREDGTFFSPHLVSNDNTIFLDAYDLGWICIYKDKWSQECDIKPFNIKKDYLLLKGGFFIEMEKPTSFFDRFKIWFRKNLGSSNNELQPVTKDGKIVAIVKC